MVEVDEVAALFLATMALAFLLLHRKQLQRVQGIALLTTAYILLYAGFIFTVLEDMCWYSQLNFLEQVCNNASIIVLVIWIWHITRKTDTSR